MGYAVEGREYALYCSADGLNILDVTNPASILDQQTLTILAEERGRAPTLCLIYGPEGLCVVPGPVTSKKETV